MTWEAVLVTFYQFGIAFRWHSGKLHLRRGLGDDLRTQGCSCPAGGRAQWQQIGAAIEASRLGTKVAIDAAGRPKVRGLLQMRWSGHRWDIYCQSFCSLDSSVFFGFFTFAAVALDGFLTIFTSGPLAEGCSTGAGS